MVQNDKSLRVLVTGSNRGLGLGLAAAFAERGDHVFAVCRRSSRELAALNVEVIDGIELTVSGSVARLPDRVGPAGLDVLICNAGINKDSAGLDDIDVGNLAEMFDVNTLGCVRVVLALLPVMKRGSKIMLVSSMGLLPLGILGMRTVGNYGYRMSKAALVSFGHALANDVRDRGIAVALTSPGRVDTDMLRDVYAQGRTSKAAIDEALGVFEAGRMLRDRMDELTLDQSPAFQRDPQGNPAIPAGVLRQLQEANATQVRQGGELAAARPNITTLEKGTTR
jgi:NAD(P)-dependent dehydrogenase (short-subunit alcohol dehydrogenase family)